MTQETLGYVELEWTCKNCGAKNKGMQPKCATCGAPMPDKAEFELPAQQQLITDQQKLEQAKEGPDQICPFCGTRNSATATQCKMCQGPLEGAKVREAGQVLGAFQDKPQPDIACPSCGTMNPATALKCKNCGTSLAATRPATKPITTAAAAAPATASRGKIGILGAAVAIVAVLALCAGGLFLVNLASRTSTESATVAAVEWERRILIQEQQLVKKSTWEDELPSDAQKLSCRREVRGTQDQPGPNTEKVCGTPYVVNQGSGAGKVVQDCRYNVLANMCDYNVYEWRTIQPIVLKGADLSPQWPSLSLATNQREATQDSRNESFSVRFQGEGKTYTYHPRDSAEFSRYSPGSRWLLEVNGLGGINKVESAR